MSTNKIPEGYNSAMPWVISHDTAKLLEFVEKAFGGKEIARVLTEDGAIGHAEFQVGDTILLAFDSRQGWPPTPAFIRLYVDDAAVAYRQALEAGATSVTEPTELAWGDVVGRVRDPLGNVWWLQGQVAELSEQEMQERFQDEGFLKAMRYLQESFDKELRDRK